MVASYELGGGWLRIATARVGKRAFLGNSGMTAPGRNVPKGGLVGVLSAAPKRAKAGSSYLGMPPMKLPRRPPSRRTSPHVRPAAHGCMWARSLVELCRFVPVMLNVALVVLVAVLASGVRPLVVRRRAARRGRRSRASSPSSRSGRWSGRFKVREYPLWSAFVWRNELADTFVEVLAVPWLVGFSGGTPLMNLWLRSLGASVGRGVWCESYWLPEADLVTLGAGASVNRGCVVQTHLFHDRILRMDRVRSGRRLYFGPARHRAARRLDRRVTRRSDPPRS